MDARFERVGGALALDLVNTASRRSVGPFRDRLNSYDDLLEWAVLVEVLTEDEAVALKERGRSEPARATRALEQTRALREAIYRVFSTLSRGGRPVVADLRAITEAYKEAVSQQQLVSVEQGVQFAWVGESSLEHPYWAAALSATDLLQSNQLDRIKECATDNCNWLFLDGSKNRSRRWCEMKDCGNRAKARRHYDRARRQGKS